MPPPSSSATPIRVGVDGFNLALPRGSGVATYARSLACCLGEMGHPVDLVYGLNLQRRSDPALRETLFYSGLAHEGEARRTWRTGLRRATVLPFARRAEPVAFAGRVVAPELADRVPPFDRLYSFAWLFDHAARHFRRYRRFLTIRVPDPPRVMHWTYPLPVRMAGAANLYTIHDLVPLRLPHTSLEDKGYYDRLIRRCLADADGIVTVSETSRRDILDLFAVTGDRVVNTWQAVETPAAAAMDAPALATRLRALFDLTPGGYFLFFGAIEPKKNLGRMLEAFLLADLDMPFVVVGGKGWRSDDELRVLGTRNGRALPGAERVRMIDHLPREQLMGLVRGARGVMFASLYEGFGLPALEAMALGTPVIASTTGSLPELVGDAALTVDPYDVEAIAAAMRRLAGDDALAARLSAAGRARASTFSAAAYKRRLADLYLRWSAPGDPAAPAAKDR